MVQNQAGAPAAPNALNFQTDPSSRASFKGFMTNLNALPNISTPQPAPMASPMPAPMVPAADVDIFQPMQMQMGGAVPALQRLHEVSGQAAEAVALLSGGSGGGFGGFGGMPSIGTPTANTSVSQTQASNGPASGAFADSLIDNNPINSMGIRTNDIFSSSSYPTGSPTPPASLQTEPPMDFKNMMTIEDAFRGIQGFADGGDVPMSTNIGGLPHMLSYITPGEASVLQDMGGTGQPGPGGVPSFVYDEAGMGFSSAGSPSMGDASYSYSDDSPVDIGGDDGPEIGLLDPLASGPGTDKVYEALAAQNAAKANAMRERNAIDQAIQNTIQTNYQDLRNQQAALPGPMAARTDLQRGLDQKPVTAPRKDALAQQIEAVGNVDNLGPDTSLLNVDMFGTEYGGNMSPGSVDNLLSLMSVAGQVMADQQKPNAVDATDPYMFDQLSNAGQVSVPKPRPDMPMSPGFVQPEIEVMSSDERRQMGMDELGITGNTIGGADQIGVTVGAPSVGPQFDNFGALDQAFPEAPISSVSGADVGFGKSTPEQEQIEKSVLDALESRTNINFGTRPKGDSINALEQLGMRAAGASGTFAGDIASKMPGGIAAIVGGALGGRAAQAMLSDITEKGYIPQYGPDGQIVATINPKTGQFGRGSVEGRIAGNMFESAMDARNEPNDAPVVSPILTSNQQQASEQANEEISNIIGGITQPTPKEPVVSIPTPAEMTPPAQLGRSLGFGYGDMPQIPSGLDNTLNNFFGLLGGFAEGGEVEKFANGGYTDTSSLEGIMEASGADTAAGQAISDAMAARDEADETPVQQKAVQTVVATPAPKQEETQTIIAQPMQNQQTAADIVQTQEKSLADMGMQAGQAVSDFVSGLISPSAESQAIAASMSSLSPQSNNLLNSDMPVGGQLTSVPVPANVADYKSSLAGVEQGIQGLSQVGRERASSGFSIPKIDLGAIADRIMGTKPSYDNLTKFGGSGNAPF